MINKFKTEELGIGFDFDVEFEENQKVNCIIGKNGIGKTQLLENIAKSLIYTHSIFSNEDDYLYSKKYIQKDINEKIKDFGFNLPLSITLNNFQIKDINKKQHKWGYIKFDQVNMNREKGFICDKPIVFIGAKNRGFTKNINPDNIKILGSTQDRFVESIKRTMSYINGDGLEYEEIANWFVARLIVNPYFVRNEQNKTNEVVTVLKLIDKLEPNLNLVTDTGLKVIFDNGKLLINGIPIDKLSTGFVSIVKIFQEIIAGYGGWSNLEDLNLVDGVVFIDEIEAHLHISWQTKIINILKDFFPNTTFYITTHSPLVLAGLKDGEAYELYKEENFVKSKAITNVDNYALNDIVNEFFGVDLNREKVDNPNKEKQKKARALLLNLTKSLDGDE